MKIEKQVMTTEVIEVETPAFFRDKYDVTSIGIYDDCVVSISKNLTWIYERNEHTEESLNRIIREALMEKNPITKEQFMESYHRNLNKFLNFKG